MKLSLVRIVLVEPRLAANLAHCARVAANFGVGDVVVVKPHCTWPPLEDPEAARIAGTASSPKLASFRRVESLRDAIEDCHLAVAFTRRVGENRRPDLTPAALATKAPSGRMALVFGNEEFGLSAADVGLCGDVCRIPTDERTGVGSMNLSHAVAVVLARIFEDACESPAQEATDPLATRGELEGLLGELAVVLREVGMVDQSNPDRLVDRAREIVDRAGARAADVAFLRGVFSKINVALGVKRTRR